eukprot:GHVT01035934.1.p1 GENE.GHVT01035934.1~~GHVT01035934.1.p1  ORF type:complete len:349 (+),score=26.74 GHVT01035934.1:316-1362(+)
MLSIFRCIPWPNGEIGSPAMGGPRGGRFTAWATKPAGAFIRYLVGVTENFGLPFSIMLLSVYTGVKGGLGRLLEASQLSYLRSLGMSSSAYQAAIAVSSTPWAMKGFFGAVSDAFALGGYSKKYYMLGACLIGSGAIAGVLLIPDAVAKQVYAIPILLFFFIQLEIAVLDLLCEGKYAELMSQKPQTGSDLVTFVWLCVGCGSLLASLVVGPIADHLGPKALLVLALPVAMQPAIFIVRNYLPETKVQSELRNKLHTNKLKEQKSIFVLATVMATAAVGMAVVGIYSGPYTKFVYSIVAGVVLAAMQLHCLPRKLALCNLYMFLNVSHRENAKTCGIPTDGFRLQIMC